MSAEHISQFESIEARSAICEAPNSRPTLTKLRTLVESSSPVHYEEATTSQWYDFIGAGGSMVGVRVLGPSASVKTRYFQSDSLGSIAVITDESGAVVERDSYDAWASAGSPTAPTIRPAA
jgi:hypothetical protein